MNSENHIPDLTKGGIVKGGKTVISGYRESEESFIPLSALPKCLKEMEPFVGEWAGVKFSPMSENRKWEAKGFSIESRGQIKKSEDGSVIVLKPTMTIKIEPEADVSLLIDILKSVYLKQ